MPPMIIRNGWSEIRLCLTLQGFILPSAWREVTASFAQILIICIRNKGHHGMQSGLNLRVLNAVIDPRRPRSIILLERNYCCGMAAWHVFTTASFRSWQSSSATEASPVHVVTPPALIWPTLPFLPQPSSVRSVTNVILLPAVLSLVALKQKGSVTAWSGRSFASSSVHLPNNTSWSFAGSVFLSVCLLLQLQ